MPKTEKINTFKGFDKNLKCRDYQFKVGESYEHAGEVKACNGGFHACEYPLDVFGYYPPAQSIYAEVEQSGTLDRHHDDSKVASSKISIKAEIKIPGIVKASIDFIHSKIDKSKKQDLKKAESNTGDRSAASNTGDRSAASNTGNYSAASNTGYQSAASVTGKNSVACALGIQSKAKASKGGWIVCAFRTEEGVLKHLKTAQVGKTKGIKPDTWYILNSKGTFVIAKD